MAAEANELQEVLANREKSDAASKTASKGCEKKRATTSDKRVATLETGLPNVKALHSRLVKVATRSEEDASKAQTSLQDSQERLIKVEQVEKLPREDIRFGNNLPDPLRPQRKHYVS